MLTLLKRIQANFESGFNNEIGFGHFKLEFLNQTNDKSFEFIAAISAMIQLIYVITTFEWSFLLQALTYLLNLMGKCGQNGSVGKNEA